MYEVLLIRIYGIKIHYEMFMLIYTYYYKLIIGYDFKITDLRYLFFIHTLINFYLDMIDSVWEKNVEFSDKWMS